MAVSLLARGLGGSFGGCAGLRGRGVLGRQGAIAILAGALASCLQIPVSWQLGLQSRTTCRCQTSDFNP